MDTSTTSAPDSDPTPREIEFFFDPMCPWCWITSRWVLEAALQRPIDVRWRLISLAVLNRPDPGEQPDERRDHMLRVGTELMRVLVATGELGNDELGRLYTELGTRIHDKGAGSRILGPTASPDAHHRLIEEALVAANLPSELLEATTRSFLDATAESETAEALARTGDDVGTPIITFDPADPEHSSFFGPVLNRIPRGPEALELFDLVDRLVAVPGLSELKRSLRGAPDFG